MRSTHFPRYRDPLPLHLPLSPRRQPPAPPKRQRRPRTLPRRRQASWLKRKNFLLRTHTSEKELHRCFRRFQSKRNSLGCRTPPLLSPDATGPRRT
ncbi:unnamed protein product [Cyprideis torosa]|uniref:Uncharacterized protein n=1 Tax=Cyprideis torosa TaxID=163714 RepID=A0A7R8WVC7_9CRUS|nr:unnamed protein product [Cyprideis torosa]CAG0907461.1 unnamed protein product [Cyprideis torosa]